ncbi:hypothetical protein CRI94_15080 [Longibacter salinarum]|uniref:Uncharacterized protein n=1 Tax=Longibacter salinarum TaxID=1850348 RepID=A0A2A8CV67_9BACT|nr:hypothetical protein CRI94_15080 [Longibacter salinarum]
MGSDRDSFESWLRLCAQDDELRKAGGMSRTFRKSDTRLCAVSALAKIGEARGLEAERPITSTGRGLATRIGGEILLV